MKIYPNEKMFRNSQPCALNTVLVLCSEQLSDFMRNFLGEVINSTLM